MHDAQAQCWCQKLTLGTQYTAAQLNSNIAMPRCMNCRSEKRANGFPMESISYLIWVNASLVCPWERCCTKYMHSNGISQTILMRHKFAAVNIAVGGSPWNMSAEAPESMSSPSFAWPRFPLSWEAGCTHMSVWTPKPSFFHVIRPIMGLVSQLKHSWNVKRIILCSLLNWSKFGI